MDKKGLNFFYFVTGLLKKYWNPKKVSISINLIIFY